MTSSIHRTTNLFECPFCEAMDCKVVASDFDDANQKGRTRSCPNCGSFSTIEVPVLTAEGKSVPLSQFCTQKRQQTRDAQRVRKGYRAIGARFLSGTVSAAVRYHPPTKLPYQTCWRGHDLIGDNVYFNPNGKRRCRPCRRLSQHEWRQANLERERVRGRRYSAARRQQQTAGATA